MRAVRQERREQPIDSGQPLTFSAEGPRRWDFGDGTPTLTAQSTSHAFARAGRYEVRGFEGERVTDSISVLVQPRAVFRAVPSTAQAAVVFRSLDDVTAAVDFAERLGAAATLGSTLEHVPLLQFLLEPGRQGRAALDPLEGAGAFLLENGWVGFAGVIDDAGALRGFTEFLLEHGWRDDGDGRFSRADATGLVFCDRGTLFFAATDTRFGTLDQPDATGAFPARARSTIETAPALGLEADPETAAGLAELASGGVAFVVRSSGLSQKFGEQPWQLVAGAVHLSGEQLRLIAKVLAGGPLWSTPPSASGRRLLAAVPPGPIAVLAADVPLASVLEAFGVKTRPQASSATRTTVDPRLDLTRDDEARAGLAVLSRRLEAALYFDVEGFLAATVRRGGRPAPRVSLVGEAAVPDRAAVKLALGRALARRKAPLDEDDAGGVTSFRTIVEDHPLELVLGTDSLSARLGKSLGAGSVNLLAGLSRRVDGAAGPGHLTLLVDVGQLGRELLEPRQVPGLDPRQVVATQALSSTFLSQMTSIDLVFVDLAPSPQGATLTLEVSLSKRQSRE